MPISCAGEKDSRPFVKWAGGKSRLLTTLRPLLPSDWARRRHVELFAGGAALFFGLGAQSACLNDVNAKLMLTYRAIRDDVASVIAHLGVLAAGHCAERYNEVRDAYNASSSELLAETAARFIYLNKTCFNGLYRVNRSGAFNVPMGRYVRPNILDEGALRTASIRLQGVELLTGDYRAALDGVSAGDFVYLDPPYQPISETASFTSYSAEGFDTERQLELHNEFVRLRRRRIRAMLSNSATPFTRKLYADFRCHEVAVHRSISCAAKTRGAATELVVCTY